MFLQQHLLREPLPNTAITCRRMESAHQPEMPPSQLSQQGSRHLSPAEPASLTFLR